MSEKHFFLIMWVTVVIACAMVVLSELGVLSRDGWFLTAISALIAPLLISAYHLGFIAPHAHRLLLRNVDLELQVKQMVDREIEYGKQLRQSQALLLNLTAGTRKQTRKAMEMEFIYFIFDKDANRVKIGISVDPDKRLASLQTANASKLSILHVIQGNVSKEQELHNRFKHLRASGEWFYYTSEIESYINQSKGQLQ